MLVKARVRHAQLEIDQRSTMQNNKLYTAPRVNDPFLEDCLVIFEKQRPANSLH